MALDATLRARGDLPVGILNGIGDDWDPLTDPLPALPLRGGRPGGQGGQHRRPAHSASACGSGPGVPVLGVVSRMDRQKGFDLLRETMPPLLARNRVQLAALGTGDPAIESMFTGLARRFAAEAAYVGAFDPALAHLIEAGADIFLMPSVFEPSGLNQMYSMRYGTPPVAHRTGGLADSIRAVGRGLRDRVPLRAAHAGGLRRRTGGCPGRLRGPGGLAPPGHQRHGAGLLLGGPSRGVPGGVPAGGGVGGRQGESLRRESGGALAPPDPLTGDPRSVVDASVDRRAGDVAVAWRPTSATVCSGASAAACAVLQVEGGRSGRRCRGTSSGRCPGAGR